MEKNNSILQKEAFKKYCYGIYQLEWMKNHGYTLDNLKTRLNQLYNLYKSENGSYDYTPGIGFSDLEEEGFAGGILWACQDEFIETEFKDKEYMKTLLENVPPFTFFPDNPGLTNYEYYLEIVNE